MSPSNPDHDEVAAPEQIGVKVIKTNQLFANTHNPRMLFDREPMKVLRESIKKVGILVPLTVYWAATRKHWTILDGQRRWMCAKDIGLTEVPVNQVAEPTLVENIVTMFQIHKLREDWELMPTALKLEVLMEELQEKREKQLATLTGLDTAVVIRCKKLLSYPKKYQDMMLHHDPTERIKADFFIELYAVRNDREVNKFQWFEKDRFTKRMLQKYLHKSPTIKAVTDFRIIKQSVNNAIKNSKRREISKRLHDFTVRDDLGIDYLKIPEADLSAEARKINKVVVNLLSAIRLLDVDSFLGEESLWINLEDLVKEIYKKLSAAGRRIKK